MKFTILIPPCLTFSKYTFFVDRKFHRLKENHGTVRKVKSPKFDNQES
jgi:hypothetical protein